MSQPFTHAQRLRGSHTLITHGEPTARFVGECGPCVRPVAFEVPEYRHDVMTRPCPDCGALTHLTRLYGTQTEDVCDGSCMGAVGPWCSCGCGGANHGKSWADVGSLPVRMMTAEQLGLLTRYRDAKRKRAATTERKRAEKAADKAAALEAAKAAYVAEFPVMAEVQALAGSNDFLAQMVSAWERYGSLTPRQLAACDRIVSGIRAAQQREAAKAARVAEASARGLEPRHVGEVGAKVSVTGAVTVAMKVDGYARTEMMIILEGTGSDEGVTVKWTGAAKAIWDLQRGDRVTLTGTVKAHTAYKGTPQTVLKLCKITPADGAPAPVAPAPVPAGPVHAADHHGEPLCGFHAPGARTRDPRKVTCAHCLEFRAPQPTRAVRPGRDGADIHDRPGTVPADVTPWLRSGGEYFEIMERLLPESAPRTCSHVSWSGGVPCGKRVVRVRWHWGRKLDGPTGRGESWARDEASGWHLSWRHADGSAPHGDHMITCEPIPRCDACGYEGTSHCSQCHAGASLTTTQQAYGDSTKCSTPGCGYSPWYDIGD